MKIWVGHGSEHSYRMVMVGKFVDATTAKTTAMKIDRIRQTAEQELDEPSWYDHDEPMAEAVRDVLNTLKIYDLSRADVGNFIYDYQVTVAGDTIRLSTDEGEVQGFLKILIGAGAKVQVYSAHSWGEDGDTAPSSEDDDEPEDVDVNGTE